MIIMSDNSDTNVSMQDHDQQVADPVVVPQSTDTKDENTSDKDTVDSGNVTTTESTERAESTSKIPPLDGKKKKQNLSHSNLRIMQKRRPQSRFHLVTGLLQMVPKQL